MKQGYNYDDVLLVPKKSSISSRFNGDIDLSVELVPGLKLKYPIISSNMDTITEYDMANEMIKLGGLGIVHRFMDEEDHLDQLKRITDNKKAVVCIGTDQGGIDRFDYLHEKLNWKVGAVLIDIAHGHSDHMIEQIKRINRRTEKPIVIAGNVATYEGALDLFNAGAACVKVGVGPGCFIGGTKVQTFTGKKPIYLIKPGDKVLTHDGTYQTVRATSARQEKETIIDINGIKCTKEHMFYVVHKEDADKITQDTIHKYAKWVKAEDLSEDYMMVKIKE